MTAHCVIDPAPSLALAFSRLATLAEFQGAPGLQDRLAQAAGAAEIANVLHDALDVVEELVIPAGDTA
ncbi:hypothetical protein SLNSH_02745 [Alsobacter soli]|uniref:Uncharacterized protein n=1 Tax=Alsobacter soli TaxID=2109933 RepID=A0A2T1HYI8_9HYPH|nr:hypothetical protein [Alsobacter soli]PSC06731.1 hypothetical protein SLNSH_02745 [Alsobacter soli]